MASVVAMLTGANFEDISLHFGDTDAAAFHRFKGFTSAVVTDEKLAAALKESLAQSLEQGTSLAQWRKEANKIFDKQGVTQLNSFQAELIHRNESALAFGAGQFAQLQRNKETFPYYSISTRKDHRVRDSHRALEGKVFRSDDSQFFPPLGINCRCAVKLITKWKAEKQGITGPDTITPEMRANLQNAEFIGDKVGNYADWLNVKIKAMPEAYKALITEKLAEIEATLNAKVDLSGVTLDRHKSAYEDILNDIPADQIALVNKLDKIKVIDGKSRKRGQYLPSYESIEFKFNGDRDSTFTLLHEYGHHIDYKLNKSKHSSFSMNDDGFATAIRLDRKGLDSIDSYLNILYRFYEKERISPSGQIKTGTYRIIKESELGNVSDILDALTRGSFHTNYFAPGHGKTYYKKKGSVPKEIFANLFQLRATKKHWELAKEMFPNLTKRFEEIIMENL